MDQNKFLEVIFEAAVENGVNLFFSNTKKLLKKKVINKNKTLIIENFNTSFKKAHFTLKLCAPVSTNVPQYYYSTITDIEFSGNFGANPIVLMVYSKNDSPIRLDDGKTLEVETLRKKKRIYNKYLYETSNENHFSSEKPKLLKPFVFICFNRNMTEYGMNVLLVLDTAKGNSIKYSNGCTHSQLQSIINFKAEGQKIIKLNNINRLFLPQNINGKEYHVSNENRLAIDSIIEELDHKIYRE